MSTKSAKVREIEEEEEEKERGRWLIEKYGVHKVVGLVDEIVNIYEWGYLRGSFFCCLPSIPLASSARALRFPNFLGFSNFFFRGFFFYVN